MKLHELRGEALMADGTVGQGVHAHQLIPETAIERAALRASVQGLLEGIDRIWVYQGDDEKKVGATYFVREWQENEGTTQIEMSLDLPPANAFAVPPTIYLRAALVHSEYRNIPLQLEIRHDADAQQRMCPNLLPSTTEGWPVMVQIAEA